MAERDFQAITQYLPMPRRGVNLHANLVELHPEECFRTKNMVYRGGLVKRRGSTKFEVNEVAAGFPVIGLHRFYYGAGNKQIIAVADTDVRYHNGSAWANIDTSRTTGKQTYMNTWGALGKCYICNGTDVPLVWNGSAVTNLSGTNYPSKALQVLPYRDRLLHIDSNNVGYLGWSGSYSDTTWESLNNIGVRPDSQLFGMILHSPNNSNEGVTAKVLIAGATDMHLFSGRNLSPVVSDYEVQSIGLNIGCTAPRTMAWTPKGSIWLGIDKQVYMLPHGEGSQAIPIGTKIRSNQSSTTSIESMAAAQIPNACAVYHDGFYKLSFASSGASVNDTQYWLDVENMYRDENGDVGPWFGPMTGATISAFATLTGSGDSGQLYAGDGTAATGFVYIMDQSSTYSDNTVAINCDFKSSFFDFGAPHLNKRADQMEFEGLDVGGSVYVDFADLAGLIRTNSNMNFVTNKVYWGQQNWGTYNWNTDGPVRVSLEINAPIEFRRLAVVIKQTSASQNLKIFSMAIKVLQGDLGFGE